MMKYSGESGYVSLLLASTPDKVAVFLYFVNQTRDLFLGRPEERAYYLVGENPGKLAEKAASLGQTNKREPKKSYWHGWAWCLLLDPVARKEALLCPEGEDRASAHGTRTLRDGTVTLTYHVHKAWNG